MYFKRIDVQGFKSFADHVSIEFHGGITCIIGPNGSGKSNISDALRWVLGEQSPKMLRGGKMEEVIFAGTASRKARGMAEVTLVIDNSKGILPIDYSEVAITRRMYRSGESEYAINNHQCRLRDIRELIMDTGIGVDGYSLIGQGKISEIVSNKPESRREIFEEAAGIVKYRSKKAESERKLEASHGNLDRVNDIISEIESRIEGLKEDSKKASQYLVLKKRYQELEINVTLKNIESVDLKNEYIKDELMIINHQIDEGLSEKDAIDGQTLGLKLKTEELERLSEQTRSKIAESVGEINQLVNQIQVNNEKLSGMEKDRQRLSDEIVSFGVKLEKERSNAEELYAHKRNLDVNLAKEQEILNQKILSNTEITERLSAQAEEIDRKKNRLFELHNKMSSKDSERNSLKNLQLALEKRKEQIVSDQTAAETENRQLTDKNYEIEGEKESLQKELIQVSKELKETRSRRGDAEVQEKETRKKLEELRVSIGQAATRKKMIEEMESNYEGYNNGVKFIMKANLPGIDGVVGELLKVPQGFEVAIETALGSAMQNIVCEDDRSAQNAVSALKANKAGRLTFLPKKSIRAAAPNYNIAMTKEEGFQGVAVECVKFSPQYRSIMNYLLARVIIVDRLEHAVKLSKKASGGLRFVTLEGEVINAGGAITGGTFRHNTANLLERRGEILKLTDKLSVMEGEKEKSKTELATLRNLIKSCEEQVASLSKRQRELELDYLSKEHDAKLIASQIVDHQSNVEKWRRELSNMAKEQQASDSMVEELTIAVEDAEAEIQEITKGIEQQLIGYETQKLQLEEGNEEITKARVAVTSAESEKNNVDNLVSRIEAYTKELIGEMEQKNRSLTEIEEGKQRLTEEDEELTWANQQKENEKESLEVYLKEVHEEKAGIVKRLDEILSRKELLEQQLGVFQTKKYELEIKQAKNETQLDNYKNRLWDEFEISYVQAIEFKKKEFHLNEAVKESREVKSAIKELGEVNIGAIREYETVSERYSFLTEQRNDLLKAMDALTHIITDMDKTIQRNFRQTFESIAANFVDTFSKLFGGGTAELRLEDGSDPLESGIEIVAQPPGKKLQNINLMSGGEKTMTAIALMFAVLKAKPTPFCILDEIEAALDDANIERFARYLKNFKEIQFALVTHQKATMEYADVLYGVTMPEQGVSKILSLKLGDEIEL